MADTLLKGFQEFKKDAYGTDSGIMPALVRDGQDPKYFIISCIDSRANPGTIFKPAPGTFFAHKAMGAIVRPYKKGTALSAALHFALNYNNVDTLVVLGHTKCGAVKALTEGLEDEEIFEFIGVAQRALDKAKSCGCNGDELAAKTEKEVILESVHNLKSYPSVASALKDKRVTIKPWLFDMERGTMLEYNDNNKTFEEVG